MCQLGCHCCLYFLWIVVWLVVYNLWFKACCTWHVQLLTIAWSLTEQLTWAGGSRYTRRQAMGLHYPGGWVQNTGGNSKKIYSLQEQKHCKKDCTWYKVVVSILPCHLYQIQKLELIKYTILHQVFPQFWTCLEWFAPLLKLYTPLLYMLHLTHNWFTIIIMVKGPKLLSGKL